MPPVSDEAPSAKKDKGKGKAAVKRKTSLASKELHPSPKLHVDGQGSKTSHGEPDNPVPGPAPVPTLKQEGSKPSYGTRTMAHYADKQDDKDAASKDFFKKEPSLFSHRVMERAAKIFQELKIGKDMIQEGRTRKASATTVQATSSDSKHHFKSKKTNSSAPDASQGACDTSTTFPSLDFLGPAEKKLTFELAFLTLKYASIFEGMLSDVGFYSVNPGLYDEEHYVMVVLYEYQSRSFQIRLPMEDETLSPFLSGIEIALSKLKTKLAGSLARRRIKAAAPTLEFLLPGSVRKSAASSEPMATYAWVNTLKIFPLELVQKLKDDGFTQLWSAPKSSMDFQSKSFYPDPHCSDVIVFSADCNKILQEHTLVQEGYIVRQDKSSCLAAHTVISLLGDEQDVLVANPGSGLTPAHVALLLKDRKCTVIVVSEHADEDHNKMLRSFELLGMTKLIKVVRDRFLKTDLEDHRFRNVRAALVIADCSKSAINNIINYIVIEGENLKMLQDMAVVTDDTTKMMRLQGEHVALLRQALQIPKIAGVCYLTRSRNEEENEATVTKAVEWVNQVQMHRKLQPWRIIPPTIPYSADEIDKQINIDGKYVRFAPSALTNGCFVACLAREPAQTAMARAKNRYQKDTGPQLKILTPESTISSIPNGSKCGKGRKPARKITPKSSGGSYRPKVSSPNRIAEHHKVVKHPAPFR